MKNKKILILGARGMAGHIIYTYLHETKDYAIATICHSGKLGDHNYELDIYDSKKLEIIIKTESPDIIVNCIGVLVRGSTENPSNAIYVNAYFPHQLSSIAHKYDSKVIHISTDCVFSGTKGKYSDSDKKDALDIYGMTKNLGEIINETDTTLRTSIIGPELKQNGEGLLHWFLANRNTEFINGYEKSIWSGITTLQLAKVIKKHIDNTNNPSGLIQISNDISISKYDLLLLFQKFFGGKCIIRKTIGTESDKSIISTKNTVNMNGGRILESYEDMMNQLYDFMFSHKELYSQYFQE